MANITEKNQLEGLFVECIEEVRKDIMKRRLKNEIFNKKKFQQIEQNTDEAREFEQSLLKLASLAKNRVKLSDFTTKDKNNLLDLFVNNEKTLLKIYEILFPHRAAPNAGAGVSSQMVQESGGGVYGQNALRQLQSKSQSTRISYAVTQGNPVPLNAPQITAQNQELLNQVNPFIETQSYLVNQQQLPNILNAGKQHDPIGY